MVLRGEVKRWALASRNRRQATITALQQRISRGLSEDKVSRATPKFGPVEKPKRTMRGRGARLAAQLWPVSKEMTSEHPS